MPTVPGPRFRGMGRLMAKPLPKSRKKPKKGFRNEKDVADHISAGHGRNMAHADELWDVRVVMAGG